MARIRLRRGTTAQWLAADVAVDAGLSEPLAEGEPGYDVDLKIYKVGDGSSKWSVLPFANEAALTELINSAVGGSVSTLPAGVTLTAYATGTTWPARPTARTDLTVHWIGADEAHPPPGALAGVDYWDRPGAGGVIDGGGVGGTDVSIIEPWSYLEFIDVYGGGGTVDPPSDITHGSQLAMSDVGPWTLQGVAPGDETLPVLVGPGRGFWRFDTPDEFAPTGTYVYNNSPSNHGGIVPAGGLTIDGYAVPGGTRVIQFRDFPDGYDFYAQGTSLKVLFRGCRFRFSGGVGGQGLFNDNASTESQQIMLHYCDVGLTSKDPADPHATGLLHIKNLGGRGHRYLRNYMSNSSTFLQPNAPDVHVIENIITDYIFGYGELGENGTGDSSVYHNNGISSEGLLTGFRALRNSITAPSPDGALGTSGSDPGEIGYGTQPGQTGYGAGSNPGRLVVQTDNIAMFAISGPNDDCQIVDNYLGGSGYCVYAGNADGEATNIVITGNRVTTQWWTNGGSFGAFTDLPAWGLNGNVQSDNLWADDYGTGGNGCTDLADRQYPGGNGPRAGTSIL